MANNRDGYPYAENKEFDISINYLVIYWGKKEKGSTANTTRNFPIFRGKVNQWFYCWLVQELDSIPLDCNSLRIIRFIHADIDSSPSIFIASLIACSSCGSTLKAICLLPLGKLVFDICNTQRVCCLCLTVYNTFMSTVKQRSPEVLLTLSGHLTKPLVEVTIMAVQQHTQTRLKFICLIASSNQRLVDIHPVHLISVQEVRHV
ncbi:hypothetical protein LY16_03226 [Xenorhabdus doucetiae]|uniref:Uncharacterized protein n=2 Tax=Xenorhabdus doucetiae TaxID=351671 RepID=A0ABY3NMX6_9GAMM|nr:hypothetical protein LY16_03226 [Xenorhabdus doucetiae]